uniref:aralkylamine N-acetyltransferase n=1 Tax=Stomoxys calcitrans TaxID=35570 RepID=A0A1I8P2D1_STOCA
MCATSTLLCSHLVIQKISSLRPLLHWRKYEHRHGVIQSLLYGHFNRSISTTQQKAKDICIRVIKPADRQRVLDFLRIHFYCDKPYVVTTTANINNTALTEPDKADEDYNISKIEHGTCLMAVDEQSQATVGVLLAGPKGPNEAELLSIQAAKEGLTKWSVILKLWERAERESNVYKRYGVQRVLHCTAMAVDRKIRGKKIGARLFNELQVLGKTWNYELMTGDCTSYYSSKLCKQLGWECVNEIYYNEYVDENGHAMLNAKPPHVCCRTYAVRL